MGKKLNYIIPALFALILVLVSSCRNNDDSAYYYNSTGGLGSGNNGCCCNSCGCDDEATDEAIPYCEPEAPELIACEDGTITIGGYKGATFATEGGACPSGWYVAAEDGVMTLNGSRQLINSDGDPLIWIAEGDVAVTVVVIPANIESMIVLPDATIVGYIDGDAITLGKLIIVNDGDIGVCSASTIPQGGIEHSVLWCGERVVVSVDNSEDEKVLTRMTSLASFKLYIPSGAYLVLTQDAFSEGASKLYITGTKDLVVNREGEIVERLTGMPVYDKDGLKIFVPTAGVTDLRVSGNALMINSGVWALFALFAPEDAEALTPVFAGNLPSGFKVSAKEGETPVMISVAKTISSIVTEQNVCIDDNGMLLLQ